MTFLGGTAQPTTHTGGKLFFCTEALLSFQEQALAIPSPAASSHSVPAGLPAATPRGFALSSACNQGLGSAGLMRWHISICLYYRLSGESGL